jgi:hypothetical protein
VSTTTAKTSDPALSERCRGFITNLVLRCGRGDESALGELVDLTFFVVAAAVKRGAQPSAGTDDEIVEAFRRIWGRSAGYEPTERGVLAWVFDQAVDGRGSGTPATA